MEDRVEPGLTDQERERYGWQIDVEGFGEAGQERLKRSSVFISRGGGLGGVVAYELAAAGVGRIIVAHAGKIKPADLNRQLLMTRAGLGQSRADSIRRRLGDLNPDLDVVTVPENVSARNAAGLVARADVVVDAAPLFQERYAMNAEAVRQGKPMVECAVNELEAHVTTIVPGKTPCLRCLYPEQSTTWTRRFPVFGAVSGTAGCLAAMEAIKVISGLGEPLLGRLLVFDLRQVCFRTYRIHRNVHCPVCSGC